MADVINPTAITPPRVAWIDINTGQPTTAFYRWLLSLFNAVGDTQTSVNDGGQVSDNNGVWAALLQQLQSLEQASLSIPMAADQAPLVKAIDGLSVTPAPYDPAVLLQQIQALSIAPAPQPYVAPGFVYATTSVNYAETATSGEKVVTAAVSGLTVTLPTAVSNKAVLNYKLMVPGTLTIATSNFETIDGGLTAVLHNQYEAVTLVSTNSNWIVV